MPCFSAFRSTGSLAVLVLALAGCASDPAKEQPVDPAAGEYHVTVTGGFEGLPFLKTSDASDDIDKRVCLQLNDAADFPEALARRYVALHPGCSLDERSREGNAFRGRFSCPLGTTGTPGGSMTVEYQGRVSTDRIELRAQARMNVSRSPDPLADPVLAREQKIAKALIEKLEARLSAVRTGDCL